MKPLSRGANKCFDLMRWYAARFREIYPYQETIARRLGIKQRQLRKYLLELKNAGLLAIHKQGRAPAVYQLFADEKCRSSAGRVPVEASVSITEFNSNYKYKAGLPADFSAEQIEHPRVQAALRRARSRIERADNPAAYEARIIREEWAAAAGRHGPGAATRDTKTPSLPTLLETPCCPAAGGNRETNSGEVAAIPVPPVVPETPRKPPEREESTPGWLNAEIHAVACAKRIAGLSRGGMRSP